MIVLKPAVANNPAVDNKPAVDNSQQLSCAHAEHAVAFDKNAWRVGQLGFGGATSFYWSCSVLSCIRGRCVPCFTALSS
jgi:hypothetical protein